MNPPRTEDDGRAGEGRDHRRDRYRLPDITVCDAKFGRHRHPNAHLQKFLSHQPEDTGRERGSSLIPLAKLLLGPLDCIRFLDKIPLPVLLWQPNIHPGVADEGTHVG